MARIAVTSRDKDLLLYLFQNKIASFEQIQKDIFGGISVWTVYRRLRKLRKAGWIECLPYMDGEKVSSYFNITSKSLEWVRESMEVTGGSLKSDSITHDMRLNDIRRFFLPKERVDAYFTENELATNSDLKENLAVSAYCSARVDAVVRMMGKKGKLCHLGVEYEHTLKSKKRCREKIKNYYLRPYAEVILFIYKGQGIYNCFVNLEKEFSQRYSPPKLFFLDIKKVLSDDTEVVFTNIRGNRVRVK